MSVADFRTYRRLRWVLAIGLIAIAGAPSLPWPGSKAEATAASSLARAETFGSQQRLISAPGRIQPKDGVLTLAAPSSLELGPAIVTELRVRAGDWVKSGQPLAILRGHDELAAMLVANERKVVVAQARLTAAKAGGKQDDIRALRAEVEGAEANVAQANSDTHRMQQLRDARIISAAALESQQSHFTVTAQTLEAARARLSSLSTVRPADVAVAEAELKAAEADVDAARAKLEGTMVRAPDDGRVLAVYTYPGQSVGAEGLLAFGKTAEMFVDAEVTEDDVGRTHVGQKVRISGDALRIAASGIVQEVGYIVGSREVFKTDPTAFADSRVVHVRISVADPKSVERLVNARVTVEIQP
jgi:HlyD family secretion protein